ncbi:MAG: hypothetical protein Kow0020_15900 [Wenzhouxiangellaceae bacterium]
MAKARDELLARARDLVAVDPAQAADHYWQALCVDPACVEASNALEQLEDPRRYSAWMKVNCIIDPRDDLLRFIARGPHGQNPIRAYLADGWRTLAELMVALERVGRPLLDRESVLEFACGFGRFTRHLAPLFPGRLAATDIVPGANDFVADQFGVTVFASATEPGKLRFPQRYSLVLVLSLLTHLPPAQWEAWLRALAGAVEPGGLLLFSVHSESTAERQGVVFDEHGCFFVPSSESSVLDPDQYGTTFTTRAFVEHTVRHALGVEPLGYQPEAFWGGQDAVIVAPSSGG